MIKKSTEIKIIVSDPQRIKECIVLLQSTLLLYVAILIKFRLCNFLTTKYKPKNQKTKVIKIKNTYEKPSEKKKRILQENIKRVKKLNKLKNRI